MFVFFINNLFFYYTLFFIELKSYKLFVAVDVDVDAFDNLKPVVILLSSLVVVLIVLLVLLVLLLLVFDY